MPAPPFRLAPEVARQHLSFYTEGNAKLSQKLDPTGNSQLFPQYENIPGSLGADYTNNLPLATIVQLFVVHLKKEQEIKKALLQRISDLEGAIESISKSLLKFGVASNAGNPFE